MATLAPTPAETFYRIADEIGPRKPGSYYENQTGIFEVLAVHEGAPARALTGRRTDWAITVRHVFTGHTMTHCMAWTIDDHVIGGTK